MIRFSFGHPDHGTSPVDQQCSQIGIATLADTKQGLLSATGVLPGNKAEPSGQLPAICEMLRVIDRSHQSTGIDLAKNVIQVHGVDERGKTVLKKSLKRMQVLPFFANLPVCLIGMEACGSAHHWARKLKTLGHSVTH